MELFHESCAIFVEGDSIDNTLSILRRWAAHSPQRRTAISYSTDSIADPNNDYSKEKGRLPREGRIAVSRNKALETLRGFAKQPDYVIVLDLDIHGVDPLGIADSFGRTTKWDVICANGVTLHGIYRDIYAFRRHDIYTNHHVVFDHSLPEQRAFVQQNRTKFYDIMSTFTRSDGENLMQVDSCFGGLAIYRAEALQDCSYAFRWNDTQKVDCEHVLFHHCLVEQNNATIYHNPIMKLWYGSALVKFGFLRA
jgi:glycosyltransferase involved in cell wall biosynthesis